ncbi:TetR/AcrR family transcriptional regulator [Phycicoccus sp. BSK3Z-2]|uniref:TetR/AcrR family transcriptional regulator n=1 Tax=Phycicoccus avicenniae TaxID=2828860 RepID=A0A941I0U2_9MICO|nr:TetR/AcrR family transcriptional regulator [Phycicoccus avicenniae]MBR7743571.1 TetR/AcrR family transcriptional regulator [Phycicoccus avicenniae]
MTDTATTRTTRGSRPRNRRELIAAAAGRAFSERGYHAVGMDDIAAAEGISAAALYRHFPNKYALFVHCATALADGLLATLDELPPDASLEETLRAVARTTIAGRASGGIYRWEARYLEPDDRAALRATFERITDRVATAVSSARQDAGAPDVGPAHARVLAAAALGAVGSVTTHRTSMAARRTEGLLADAAVRVALATPGHADHPTPVPAPPRAPAPGRRGQILDAAVPLFHRDGYPEVSMGDIAAAVGLTPSGLYRHYRGKADILLAACLEAADLLERTVAERTAGARSPSVALSALADAYVGYSFEHTALTSVATAESGGLPAAVQRPLRAAQREHVARWEAAVRAVRPDLDPTEARVLVHAGLGVVTEAGRAVHWADTAEHRALVADLVLAALGAPPADGPTVGGRTKSGPTDSGATDSGASPDGS